MRFDGFVGRGVVAASAMAALVGLMAGAGCASGSAEATRPPATHETGNAVVSALPDVAPGQTCGAAEVTLERGGLTPPLRFDFRPGEPSRVEQGAYAVETRVTDYNADRCWVAVRVTHLQHQATHDFVLRPEVDETVVYGEANRAPNLKSPFAAPALPRPTSGVASPDLCDPFGDGNSATCEGGRADELSVVVTVHRRAPTVTPPTGTP